MKNKKIKVGNNEQNVNIFELQDQFLMDGFNQNTEVLANAINQLDTQSADVKKSANEASSSAKSATTAANLAKSAADSAKNEVSQFGAFRQYASSGITAINQTNIALSPNKVKIPLNNFSSAGSTFRIDNGEILVAQGCSRATASGVIRVTGAKYGDRIGAYIYVNNAEMYFFYGVVPISSISTTLEKNAKKVATALDKKIVTADKKKVLGEDTTVKKEEINLAKSIELTVNAGDLYLHIPPIVFPVSQGSKIMLKVCNLTRSQGRVEQGFTTLLTLTGIC